MSAIGKFIPKSGAECRRMPRLRPGDRGRHGGPTPVPPVWERPDQRIPPGPDPGGTFMTMLEHGKGKRLDQIKSALPGDAHLNAGSSPDGGSCHKMGMGSSVWWAPESLLPGRSWLPPCRLIAEETGARIHLTEDVEERGVLIAELTLHYDVWVSMGRAKGSWDQQVKLMTPYQVNMDVINATKNPDAEGSCTYCRDVPQRQSHHGREWPTNMA